MKNFTDISQNVTIDMLLIQWLEQSYAHQMSSSPVKSLLIVMYVFSVTLAIIGNIIVIIIISQALARRIHISMYQLNLALADLLMSLFCVPFTFAQAQIGYWPIGSVACPIVLFMQLCFVSVSAYTNMAIGIDRFCGVIFPLKWKLTGNQRKFIVGSVWSVAAAIALPEVAVGRSESQYLGNVTQHLCNEYWSEEGQKESYTLAVFILVLVIPLSTLAVTYSCVVYTLWLRETPGNADIRRDRRRLYSKKKVTRMLMIVVAMFAACWLPLHLFNVLVDFHPAFLHTTSETTIQTIFFTCHWVAMSHAFINPIIYAATDEDFRDKAWKLITCRKGTCVKIRSSSVNGSIKLQSAHASLKKEKSVNASPVFATSRESSARRKQSITILKLPASPLINGRSQSQRPDVSPGTSGSGICIQQSSPKHYKSKHTTRSYRNGCMAEAISHELEELV